MVKGEEASALVKEGFVGVEVAPCSPPRAPASPTRSSTRTCSARSWRRPPTATPGSSGSPPSGSRRPFLADAPSRPGRPRSRPLERVEVDDPHAARARPSERKATRLALLASSTGRPISRRFRAHTKGRGGRRPAAPAAGIEAATRPDLVQNARRCYGAAPVVTGRRPLLFSGAKCYGARRLVILPVEMFGGVARCHDGALFGQRERAILV